MNKEQGLVELQKFCAYQERCHQEVRTKLLKLKIYGHDLEEIIADLINENFLNEERFARSFARGKFRIKQWGKIKIESALKFKDISPYCLRAAMTEIDNAEYWDTLVSLLTKKMATLKEPDIYKQKAKLAAFAMQRGYESTIVWEVINEIFK